MERFNYLIHIFKREIDSIGIENMDAKPLWFYKGGSIYNALVTDNTFTKIDRTKSKSSDANIFSYFKKSQPEKPIGALLFDSETNKLLSWIVLNQGGYRYFLTFNLLKSEQSF